MSERSNDSTHRMDLVASDVSLERNLTAEHFTAALQATSESDTSAMGIAMYIHLPFCPSRCLSCDHHSIVSHDGSEIDRYLEALDREMRLVSGHLGEGTPLVQLHLGGGSPNYLTDTQLVRLLEVVERHFTLQSDTDTSLEVNPKRTSASQLELIRGLGFKRINFEVRDLDSDVQMALGRVLSLAMLEDAFQIARDVGFESIGMDLVYGLPSQSLHSIRTTVQRVLALAPDRLSCYSFARRPEVFSHQRAIACCNLPSLADKMAMFNCISQEMLAGGYNWIGLDCFARADDALSLAQSEQRLHRNWIGYTHHTSSDVIGFGTNAVSELGNLSVRNLLMLSDWHDALDRGEFPVCEGVKLSSVDFERRRALNDLLCNMTLENYAALRQQEGESLSPLQRMEQDGMVSVTPARVDVTPQGRQMLHQMWGDASPQFRWGGAW